MPDDLFRYPMLMIPALKDYIWGGQKLKTRLGKTTDLPYVAESWELSCHPDGYSVIGNGIYAGTTLAAYVEQFGSAVVGPCRDRTGKFPLLVKLIDAYDKLSVQVHPDDDYARKNCHDSGKNELWYILDCEPGAELLLGFSQTVSRAELAERISNKSLPEIMDRVPVQKGDAFYIPAGTIHAIGRGILIAEIQQNSNATFRVFDYDRKDKNNQTRELHIWQALDVIHFESGQSCRISQTVEQHRGFTSTRLAANDYFTVALLNIHAEAILQAGPGSFQACLCTEGRAVIGFDQLQAACSAGQTVFIPAGSGQYKIAGPAKVLLISQ